LTQPGKSIRRPHGRRRSPRRPEDKGRGQPSGSAPILQNPVQITPPEMPEKSPAALASPSLQNRPDPPLPAAVTAGL